VVVLLARKKGVAAEENVGDDGCTRRANELVLSMRVEVIKPVGPMSEASVFDDFEGDVAKRSGERREARQEKSYAL